MFSCIQERHAFFLQNTTNVLKKLKYHYISWDHNLCSSCVNVLLLVQLFGLGVANICGSFFSAYPATGNERSSQPFSLKRDY